MGRMFDALETIRVEGALEKGPGGYWRPPGKEEPWFTTGTIQALEKQGYVRVERAEESVQAGAGRFIPARAVLEEGSEDGD